MIELIQAYPAVSVAVAVLVAAALSFVLSSIASRWYKQPVIVENSVERAVSSLEKLQSLLSELNETHKDPHSKFATVDTNEMIRDLMRAVKGLASGDQDAVEGALRKWVG